MNTNARKIIGELRQESGTAFLGSINEEGCPVMRAMLVLEHDSLKTQYFSTNTPSGKVSNYRKNPKASVYYCRPGDFKGVLFTGEMQVCEDQETKDFLWREGFECYYPKGRTDPDYCVLKFTATNGFFYGQADSTAFMINELEE
jgi:general stress protein 26